MFVLNNKFGIGEEVYSITMSNIDYVCPCCNGSGKLNVVVGSYPKPGIEDSTMPIKCYFCDGVGLKQDASHRIWVVMGPCRVSSVKARFTEEGVADVRYTIYGQNGSNKRGEGRLFRTIEEAQMLCDDMNSEIFSKMTINN